MLLYLYLYPLKVLLWMKLLIPYVNYCNERECTLCALHLGVGGGGRGGNTVFLNFFTLYGQ